MNNTIKLEGEKKDKDESLFGNILKVYVYQLRLEFIFINSQVN